MRIDDSRNADALSVPLDPESIMQEWIYAEPAQLAWVVLSATVFSAAVLLSVRILGLRSFSKMSSYDFVMTVAVGSLMASTLVAATPSLAQGLAGLAALFTLQYLVARARLAGGDLKEALDNEPLLLMESGRMIHENMEAAKVTEDDLIAKLRESNVLQPSEVRAVVLETTGDISVLHGPPDGQDLHPLLLSGVRTPGSTNVE